MPISHHHRVLLIALCRSMAQQLLDADEAMQQHDFAGAFHGQMFQTLISAFEATGCVHKKTKKSISGMNLYTWILERTELAETIFERVVNSDEDAARVLWPPANEAPVEEPAAEEATESEAPAEEPASQEQLVELIANVLQGFKASIESIDAKVGSYGGVFIELCNLVGKLNAEKPPPPAPISTMDESVADLVLTAVAENTEAVKKLTEKTGELNFLLSKFTHSANSLQAERDIVHHEVSELKALHASSHIEASIEVLVAAYRSTLESEGIIATKLTNLADGADRWAKNLSVHSANVEQLNRDHGSVYSAVRALSENIRFSMNNVMEAIAAASRGEVVDPVLSVLVEDHGKKVVVESLPPGTSLVKTNGKKKLPTLSKIVAQKDEKKTIAYQESVVERILALPESVKSNITMDPDTNAPVYKPKYALITPQKEDAK
jgi:hypothetical protein